MSGRPIKRTLRGPRLPDIRVTHQVFHLTYQLHDRPRRPRHLAQHDGVDWPGQRGPAGRRLRCHASQRVVKFSVRKNSNVSQ